MREADREQTWSQGRRRRIARVTRINGAIAHLACVTRITGARVAAGPGVRFAAVSPSSGITTSIASGSCAAAGPAHETILVPETFDIAAPVEANEVRGAVGGVNTRGARIDDGAARQGTTNRLFRLCAHARHTQQIGDAVLVRNADIAATTVARTKLCTRALAIVCTLHFIVELTDVSAFAPPHAELATTISARFALLTATLESADERRTAIRIEAAPRPTLQVGRQRSALKSGRHGSHPHNSRDGTKHRRARRERT